jgi:hypothetical protein
MGLVREAQLDPALLFQQAPGVVHGAGQSPVHDAVSGANDSGSLKRVVPGSVSAALLLNSLGCRPIRAVNGQALGAAGQLHGEPGSASSLAESFWRRLLGDG